MRIEINRDLCIGAASCVVIAPGTFEMDDENKVILIDAQGNDAQTILEAAQSCPTAAITLIDDDGHQYYP